MLFIFFFLQPQSGLPDVFVWMISGGKRVAYTRIRVEDILYSKVDSERGQNCGRIQTIFLRVNMIFYHYYGFDHYVILKRNNQLLSHWVMVIHLKIRFIYNYCF